MSRVLTEQEMREALSRAQQRPQEATERPTPTAPLPSGFRALDGQQMPLGWLNSVEGSKWMADRAEAFANMKADGRMNFGFLPKKDK